MYNFSENDLEKIIKYIVMETILILGVNESSTITDIVENIKENIGKEFNLPLLFK